MEAQLTPDQPGPSRIGAKLTSSKSRYRQPAYSMARCRAFGPPKNGDLGPAVVIELLDPSIAGGLPILENLGRFRHGGSKALPAGPAYLDDFVLHIAVIPAQKSGDLLYREATNQHVAQLDQFRIRPLFGGVLIILGVGPARASDRGANQA